MPKEIHLEKAVERYSATLDCLEQEQEHLSSGKILDVLSAREEIYRLYSDKTNAGFSGSCLEKLISLDERLKRQAERFTQVVNLEAYRTSLKPPPEAWWWYFQARPPFRERFSWVIGALTILLFTVSLALLSDISSRFLSGGADILGLFAVFFQTALAFIFTGGVITKTGREAFEKIFKSFDVPSKYWDGIRIGSAVVVLSLLVLVRFSLPRIAVSYNDSGVEHLLAGQYTSALYDFNRAIRLNPDYIQAHFNLGNLYEELQNNSSAETEYKIAAQGGLESALNNLSRLYILDHKYDLAVPLLLTGLKSARNDDVRYDLHKNMGWARLGQNRLEEAAVSLRSAVVLKPDNAPAHCLLAQVLDGLNASNQAATGATTTGTELEASADAEWESCLRYADARRPDEDAWIYMARLRLGGNKP